MPTRATSGSVNVTHGMVVATFARVWKRALGVATRAWWAATCVKGSSPVTSPTANIDRAVGLDPDCLQAQVRRARGAAGRDDDSIKWEEVVSRAVDGQFPPFAVIDRS